jgi:hypothetical protein
LLFLFSFTASMVLLCENSLELSAAAIPAISCHDRCWQTWSWQLSPWLPFSLMFSSEELCFPVACAICPCDPHLSTDLVYDDVHDGDFGARVHLRKMGRQLRFNCKNDA